METATTEQTMELDPMPETVQMSIKLPKEIRDEIKIHAIRTGEKVNDIIIRWITIGLKKDKKE